MRERKQSVLRLVIAGTLIVFLFGCASAFIKGGALVKAGYVPQEVLITYKAEGIVPPNVEYQLVNSKWGEAMFEKSPDGSGVLFLLRWEDDEGEHFGGWVARSTGYEFVVPRDRTKNVKKYVYVAGTYRYEKMGNSGRLVSDIKVDPVATLIPK